MASNSDLREAVLNNLYTRIKDNTEVEPSVLTAAIAYLKNFDKDAGDDKSKAAEIADKLQAYAKKMPFKVVGTPT